MGHIILNRKIRFGSIRGNSENLTKNRYWLMIITAMK